MLFDTLLKENPTKKDADDGKEDGTEDDENKQQENGEGEGTKEDIKQEVFCFSVS